MTSDSRKEIPNRKSTTPQKTGIGRFFRPRSPFDAKKNEGDEKLPDWARQRVTQQGSHRNTTYNFDWLSNSPTKSSNSSGPNTRPHPDVYEPPQTPPVSSHPPETIRASQQHVPETFEEDPNLVREKAIDVRYSNDSNTDDQLPPEIQDITTSTAEHTLETARALSKDGKLQAALGHYLFLVKSDKKLKHVIADLEAERDNPHTKQTPLMLQTLADAYMKTGDLAQALPLYRQALGR